MILYNGICIVDIFMLTILDRCIEFFKITKLSVKEDMMKLAKQREDDLGLEVYGRLAGIIDLVAEEAGYHRKCYCLLQNQLPSQSKVS